MNRRSFFKTILAGLGMVAVPSVFVAAAKPVLVEEKPREMILDWEGRDWYKSRKPMTATEVLRRQEEAAKELDHNLSELWREPLTNLHDKTTNKYPGLTYVSLEPSDYYSSASLDELEGLAALKRANAVSRLNLNANP